MLDTEIQSIKDDIRTAYAIPEHRQYLNRDQVADLFEVPEAMVKTFCIQNRIMYSLHSTGHQYNLTDCARVLKNQRRRRKAPGTPAAQTSLF